MQLFFLSFFLFIKLWQILLTELCLLRSSVCNLPKFSFSILKGRCIVNFLSLSFPLPTLPPLLATQSKKGVLTSFLSLICSVRQIEGNCKCRYFCDLICGNQFYLLILSSINSIWGTSLCDSTFSLCYFLDLRLKCDLRSIVGILLKIISISIDYHILIQLTPQQPYQAILYNRIKITTFIIIIMHPQQKGPSNCSLCFFLLTAVIATSAVIVLTILLLVWEYSGFKGTSPLVITTCTSSYHLAKYKEIDTIDKTVFIACCISGVSGIFMVLGVVSWICKNCQKSVSLTLCLKVFLYFMNTLMFYAILPLIHYLTLILELKQCTVTKNNTHLVVFTVLAGVTVIFALIFWLMLICKACEQEQKDEQKERRITKYLDSPIHNLTNSKEKYFAKENINNRQDTKQNMLESRTKSPNNRQIQPIFLQRYSKEADEYKARFVPRTKNENPVLNLHPHLSNNKESPYYRLTEQRKTSFRNIAEEDDIYFQNQRRRHYRQYDNRSILQRTDPRDYDDRRYDRRDYIRDDPYPRNDSYERNRRRDDYDDRDDYRNDYFDDRDRGRGRQPPPRYGYDRNRRY